LTVLSRTRCAVAMLCLLALLGISVGSIPGAGAATAFVAAEAVDGPRDRSVEIAEPSDDVRELAHRTYAARGSTTDRQGTGRGRRGYDAHRGSLPYARTGANPISTGTKVQRTAPTESIALTCVELQVFRR
jgi:hypothetical protein